MAETAECVEARFVTKEVNDAGIYLMSFYINGIKTPVVVDDYIPTRGEGPCFARSNDGELWVCLMEKAWAKLYGTYARMEGGDPAFAAVHLNGSPAKTIWH
jgi:calpain-15